MQKLAIVRTDLIGDFILWLDSAQHLKILYPETKITLFCNSKYYLLAKELPYFDEIISIDSSKILSGNLFHILKTIYSIRKYKFDLAICPVRTRNIVTELILFFLKAKRKITTNYNFGRMKFIRHFTNLFYNDLLDVDQHYFHELNYNAEIMKKITGVDNAASICDLSFLIDKKKTNLVNYKDYVIVSISTSNLRKNWPLANFIPVVNRLLISTNVVFLGSHNEIDSVNYILSQVDNVSQKNKLINLVGKTNLIELLNVVGYSAFVFAHDSAISHIAASLNIPVICLLAGGDYGRFFPYTLEILHSNYLDHIVLISNKHKNMCFNCEWKCRFKVTNNEAWPCTSSIAIADALIAIDKFSIKYIKGDQVI